jgi:2-polyprenyl-6-methoxyphenol hydroxylase-like FAD-dependent oxidoreductase
MTDRENLQTRCCIAGGGPAGMMLGFLLARAGVEVVVLEKHADFFRDFRGDTIHPSTLELMHELGLLPEFLQLPHQEMGELRMTFDGEPVTMADFSHLPTKCKFIAFMPQWDFLKFLAERGKRYPTFQLRMETEATDLVRQGDRTVGLRARTPRGELRVTAELVVAADGRSSILRDRAGLQVEDFGVPIDALWLRLPRPPHIPKPSLGYAAHGRFMVLIDRGDYFQCGVVIPKGTFEAIQEEGIPAFRREIATLAPSMREAVGSLSDWDEVKLLTVKIDRLLRWHRPGLLCIGDAAHAMSPALGVGINLAIQDAVATANLLAAKLGTSERIDERLLHAVQARRETPARHVQAIQGFLHRRLFKPQPGNSGWAIKFVSTLFRRLPFLRRVPARIVGVGFRPEHIETPSRQF